MLTGDKCDTALMIATSCKLIKSRASGTRQIRMDDWGRGIVDLIAVDCKTEYELLVSGTALEILLQD